MYIRNVFTTVQWSTTYISSRSYKCLCVWYPCFPFSKIAARPFFHFHTIIIINNISGFREKKRRRGSFLWCSHLRWVWSGGPQRMKEEKRERERKKGLPTVVGWWLGSKQVRVHTTFFTYILVLCTCTTVPYVGTYRTYGYVSPRPKRIQLLVMKEWMCTGTVYR